MIRDPNFAPHPLSDASVVAIPDGVGGRNDFPFHLLSSTAHHSSSFNASLGSLNETSQSGLVLSALMCAIISDLENSLPGIIAGTAAFNALRNIFRVSILNPRCSIGAKADFSWLIRKPHVFSVWTIIWVSSIAFCLEEAAVIKSSRYAVTLTLSYGILAGPGGGFL
ncbi:uncharacterized protein VTP21DRAFT_9920 [Calcarisporiella thermophila]|uniref:uncharacterized protein n=1 Tax=Calcarisporiella thermophila TaxID=911321 RepID=UPI0037423C1A